MHVIESDFNFDKAHAVLDKFIADDLLVMAASVVLDGVDIVDFYLTGHQNREEGLALQEDAIYRIFSNTKLLTNTAIMQLWERGKFDLDDPLVEYFPEFNDLVVLRTGASDPSETEPLQVVPTIRDLLTHTAGFSYGIFQESPVDSLYLANQVLHPPVSLANMIQKLKDIPLANQPRTRFQYSVSADIAARMVEILSGQSFGAYLQNHIFDPLRMVDTGFTVKEGAHERLCPNYTPANLLDPMEPGLFVAPDTLGGFLEPKELESGGGGLVSTIGDYTRFSQMVQGQGAFDGEQILKSDTLEMMMENHLPPGKVVQLPNWEMPNTGFGIGFGVKLATTASEPPNMIGERHWGGLAGTHTWFNGSKAGLVFTQRMFGFWHPFIHEYKRAFYQAIA